MSDHQFCDTTPLFDFSLFLFTDPPFFQDLHSWHSLVHRSQMGSKTTFLCVFIITLQTAKLLSPMRGLQIVCKITFLCSFIITLRTLNLLLGIWCETFVPYAENSGFQQDYFYMWLHSYTLGTETFIPSAKKSDGWQDYFSVCFYNHSVDNKTFVPYAGTSDGLQDYLSVWLYNNNQDTETFVGNLILGEQQI